jgi:hypothetical protein
MHNAIRLQSAERTTILVQMASRHDHSHAASEQQLRHEGVSSSRAERAATWLSLACAVHCLLMPLAISVMPLLGASGLTHLGERAELVMTLLVVASALAGVSWGYRRHRDIRFVYATAVGLAVYLLGHSLGHDQEGSWYAIGLAVLGGLTLAGSSFLSARLSHACSHATCSH